MRIRNFNKQLTIALVAAVFGGILLSSANAASLPRKVVVILPPPTLGTVVSR